MLDATEKHKSQLIAQVVKAAKSRLSATNAKTVSKFIHNYYDNVSLSDLADTPPDSLFYAALAHWKLAAVRKPGKTLLRVYNPSKKSDGWDCEHTVIEIVNDDMPFLVDSVTSELNRQELTVHLVVHPVIGVTRAKNDKATGLVSLDKPSKGALSESYMHLQVTQQSGKRLKEIQKGLDKVINDVRAAVEDWMDMRQVMWALIDELDTAPKGVACEDVSEAQDFLRWAHDDHFTFLGYREYDFIGNGKAASVIVNRQSGKGVLRKSSVVLFRELQNLASMPPEVRAFVSKGDLLIVNKADAISTVHRPVHMDSIAVKRYNAKGKVIGQRVFVGLFTSSAYNRSPRDIPLLRLKLQKTFDRAGFAPASHDGKALLNIIETYPRDELFQVSDDQLLETSLGILHLQERQRVALFLRRDDFERFISCLVYVPRDRFSTALRLQIQQILERALGGAQLSYYIQLGDSSLARLHINIQTTPGEIPEYNAEKIEAKLVEVAHSWNDRLQQKLTTTYSEEEGQHYYMRYRQAFMSAYQDQFNATQAVEDIERIEETLETGNLSMSLYRPVAAEEDRVWFKVYQPDKAIPLSDVLPMLEDMGLRVLNELPYEVRPDTDGGRLVMIHDFGLQTRDGSQVNMAAIRNKFQDAFARIWAGEVESDGFNALVLLGGLGWRDVMVLRACCKYLRQAGIAFSQDYMEQTLANNPHMARQIVELFKARFDPASKGKVKVLQNRLDGELEKVQSADEDRILRRYINLVMAMLRTNFYQTVDGAPKPSLSFKLDSQMVDELPLPRPFREIFVYSPRVEGIHLRFGMVARGGLRWSDRREDFRTEILGLVKAQQVKNTVIIPVGSKGGFVLKKAPDMSDREAFQAEGIACYKAFISGLLDITDNLDGNKVVPPENTVRIDGDDPYLVVAADKGTATFSDIANSVSIEYGFWLGDAFASGGSAGYDHKKMGITARGGWESVKRHFREMDFDCQKQDFNVIGVGDMSGDVFGNGMLLSPHIRLIGAFNHMHIFVDPDPDAAKTIVERKRMFKLPRSSWTDFDAKLISKGGGIFDRSAKSIALSDEIRKRFDIVKTSVTPNELIRILLTAKTDLLWFGGIGTYIKESGESHLDVGDRANDAIRINASELNCKIIGEGANLGVTQRARIEAALGGVRLYADSIDNSAGVDCSDHEVNIKILIDKVVARGDLPVKQRNPLLARMTNEIGLQVLVDNYGQTQAINMILFEGMGVFDNQVRLMRMLERSGRLNREVEFLPDDETLIERGATKTGLTGPEIAVLMSYAKIWVNEELLASDLPDDKALLDDLITYFPTPLRETYKKEIINHRLNREIIATQATNSIINRAGGSFIHQLVERTGMPPSDVVKSYIIARRCLGMRTIWNEIDALDNKVPAAIQTRMRLDTNRLIEWVTLWFLRNGRRPLDIASHVVEFADGFGALYDCLGSCLPKHYQKDIINRGKPYVEAGVPKALAKRVAGLVNMFSGCDIIRLASSRNVSVSDAAQIYFAIGTRFHLGSLRAAADKLETRSHWQKLAVAALIEEIYSHQLALASQVMDASKRRKKNFDTAEIISDWASKTRIAVERTEQLIAELSATEINDLSMIAVASRQLRTLAEMPAGG
ncbi:MAG: NAD-glutamate dehydrogenase [Rhodospirillaceae bacterium]|nr:NAD-glutamate dehydrogenase [Rhodospirillaceae bacterium]MBL6931135.1 NAD-glutamate dehydrogenase [Rhodospirillales bacterium]